MKVLVTGAAGFVGGYLVKELIDAGYDVVGLDNYSRYGPIVRTHDSHPNYRLIVGDCKDEACVNAAMEGCDYAIAAAAMIGGIAFVHAYAYDLLAENERILACTFDAAIRAYKRGTLKRIAILSSSMVYESTTNFPTPEEERERCPAPRSTYGFQKLAAEYFAMGAHQQYGLPYAVARLYNCVGTGEAQAARDPQVESGNIKLTMSHVMPDLALKVLRGQDPLHILGDGSQVRCYTHGSDLARGIRLCMETPAAENKIFNLSTDEQTDVRRLATMIWEEVHGDRPLSIVSDKPFEHDVRISVPDTKLARDLLGFRAKVPLQQSVKEVVSWVRDHHCLS